LNEQEENKLKKKRKLITKIDLAQRMTLIAKNFKKIQQIFGTLGVEEKAEGKKGSWQRK